MKRYIKSSTSFISDLDAQIRSYLGSTGARLINSFPADEMVPGRGGYVYMFKMPSGNVYRVFADDESDELIFQQIAVAFYVGGTECYDEAVDFEYIKGHQPEWFSLFKKWINQAETEGLFTEYDYEE